MKSKYTTLIYILASFLLSGMSTITWAQVPNYLHNSSKWRIDATGLSFSAPCWTSGKYVCEIVGDTTIGPHTYKKIIHHGFWHEQPIFGNMQPCAPDYTFSFPYAFLRQDSLKMYIYDNADLLLYDFNLEIGDTLPLTYNNFAENITVESIDFLQVGLEMRKVFQLSSNNGDISELIEGIGHNYGLIGTMQPFEFFENGLVCFTLADTSYYPNLGAPCDLDVSVGEIVNFSSISVFPNPVTEIVSIRTENSSAIQSVSLSTLLGERKSIDFRISDEKTIDLNLKNQPSGIYFIEIVANLQDKIRVKILKN
jgi:hypothetical protein